MIRRLRLYIQAALGGGGRPALTLAVYWGCAALALPIAAEGGYVGAVGGAFAFSLALLFLGYSLGNGSVSFVAAARELCLPGFGGLKRRVSLLAGALLALAGIIPCLALVSSSYWHAWIPALLLCVAALAGVLAPRVPSTVAIASALLLTIYWVEGPRADPAARLQILLWLGSAALAIAVVAKWRQVDGRNARDSTARRAFPRDQAVHAGAPLLQETSVAHVVHYESRDPASPARIVRTCFGGLFGTSILANRAVRTGRRTAFIASTMLLFAVAGGLPWIARVGWRFELTTLVAASAGWLWMGYSWPIAKVLRNANGELSELALMPGLGDARSQRRSLYRTLLGAPLLWLGCAFATGSAVALLQGAPRSSPVFLALCFVMVWAAYSWFVLQMLVSPRAARNGFSGGFLVFYVCIYAPQLLAIRWPWPWAPWLVASFLLVPGAVMIYLPARKLATAPHPFLG